MSDSIQTCIVGYGMAARVFHAPLISVNDDFELYSFVERHDDRAQQKYSSSERYKDTSQMLENESIELVIITTPNTTHYTLAKKALEAGKHVVVEKPFAPTSKQAQELIDLAKKEGLILSVFHNRRWDSDFLTVQKLIEDGKVGRLVELESHFDRFRNHPKKDAWRERDLPGSGILYDLGSHLIDQAQVLFGLPEAITADVRRQRNFGEADDCFDLHLHYPGKKVVLKSSMLVKEDSPRFILHGTEAAYVKYGLDPQEDALEKGQIPGEKKWGREAPEHWGTLYLDENGEMATSRVESEAGNYPHFYQNIAGAIRGENDLEVTPQEARDTIRIIEKSIQSSEEGRTVPFDLLDE